MAAGGQSVGRKWSSGGGLGSPLAAPYDRPPPRWPELPRAGCFRNQRTLLARAVELEVVPRLVLAGRPASAPAPAGILPASIEEFTDLVLGKDPPLAVAYIERARVRGLSVEALYLELLGPAALRFGDLWAEDLLDFTQVTIGLGRLHQMLRELSPAFQGGTAQPVRPSLEPAIQEQRALLVAAPGEQHTFGLAMVTEFFRRAAWVVWSGAPAPGSELVDIVHNNWFGIVGFSLGSEARLDALRSGIRSVRQASRNRRVGIIVGGPVFIEHPEYVTQVGADAMAADGRQAVMRAQAVLTLQRASA